MYDEAIFNVQIAKGNALTKKRKRSTHYVNNRDLYESLKIYRAAYLASKEKGEPKPPLPNYVGECIMLIANRMASKRGFKNYSYLEEMIADGIENTVMYIHNFNPDKSTNPFGYITITIKRAFIRRIALERRQQYVTLKSSQNYRIADQLNPDQIMGETIELYDNLQEFIVDYEESNGLTAGQAKKKSRRNVTETSNNKTEFWA